jgi:hypothetical protein
MSELTLHNHSNGRRSFLKLLAAAPLFATIGTRSLAAAVASTAKAATGARVLLLTTFIPSLASAP